MNWKIIRIIDAFIGIPLVYAALFVKRLLRSPGRAPSVTTYKRILLVKFWGIGNIFMMLPAVNALRRCYADAEIDLLTLKTNLDAADYTKVFSRVHAIETKGYGRFAFTTVSMLRAVRERHYDLIIDFEQFARFSALFIALSQAKMTIGFRTEGQYRHFLFGRAFNYDNHIHITSSYCALARTVAEDSASCDGPYTPVLHLSDCSDTSVLERLGMRSEETVIVLHVGTSSNFRERRWPAASWAVLADLFVEHCEARIVLTGLAEEAAIAAEVNRQARSHKKIVDASGKLNFWDYLELIRVADVIVSADTAAVHIASALGKPVAGLYGPNTPTLYGPWGESGISFYLPPSCSPCITNFNAKTHDCKHPEGKGACMKKIDPEDVYRAICERYFEGARPKELTAPADLKRCVV